MKNLSERFIPADHSITAEALGLKGLTQMIIMAGLSYRRTMVYLLKKGRYRDLFNFIYTKTLVPTGEGSGELAYYIVGPLLRRQPKLAPYPRFIEIEITTRCNKKCIICEHTWWKEPNRDLTLQEFKSLVDQFPLRWVNLTGEGDAFLNPDYLNMIRYLKAKGVSIYLVDSFDLINKKIAYELVSAGVDGIYISMDAVTKETYEKIKAGCHFDKVVENIRSLLEIKKQLGSPLPEICFRFVINKLNVHEMANFVKLVRSIGTRKDYGDGSKIHYVGLLDYPEIHDLYLPTIPEEYVRETLAAQKSDLNNLPVVFAHTETDKNPSINRCLAWMEPYFALVPHQMVLPCCAVLMSNSRKFLSEYCFGDYTKEPLKKIWDHPYYKWFKQTVTRPDAPVPALCRGCRAYDTTQREKLYGIDWRRKVDFE